MVLVREVVEFQQDLALFADDEGRSTRDDKKALLDAKRLPQLSALI